MTGGGDLVGSFLERTGFKATMKMNTDFILDEECTETRAGQVLT